MEPDLHEFFLDIDDGYIGLRVVCPYDRTHTNRPCWPHHSDGSDTNAWVPDEAPQDECTYESWVDNLSTDELLHGRCSVPLPTAQVSWENGDYPIITIGDTA